VIAHSRVHFVLLLLRPNITIVVAKIAKKKNIGNILKHFQE